MDIRLLKLGTRLVLMLFLLSFGLVNSNGYSFPSKPFQIETAQQQSFAQKQCQNAAIDDPSAYLECDKVQVGASSVGDKLVIKTGDQSQDLFIEKCDSDETCSHPC